MCVSRTPIAPSDPNAPPTTSGTAFAMFTFLLFIWITMVNESMCRAALMIAPDAPTLGLAISSIVLLFYRRKPVVLVGAAGCAVLACWCKQSAIPFLFVAPLYILIADGLIAAISYVLILAIVGAVTSTAMLLSFGPFNMQFHMMQLPAAHGWENEDEFSRLQLFFRAVLALIQELLPTLGLIAFTLLVRHLLLPKPIATVGPRKTRIIAWARANPWLMFVIAAIFLLPSALLGFLKVGGYVNNFSLTHTFVLLTAMTLLMRLYAQIRSLLANASSMALPIAPTHVRTIVLCSVGLLVMLEWPKVLLDPKRMSSTYRTIARPWDNQQEKIYDFAQANPGIVYFPWNTLSTLLAERRLYHFEWGLHDRYEADITPSNAQIRAHPTENPLRCVRPFPSG